MATWIVGSVLILIVAAIVWKMASDRKNGRSACGGNCASCHGACGMRAK
ncbi:MAG: FeoB-associated Cys-rich membrane protein [Eubacteriales bacterium]|nr:FeoB-associated Cys-rich membrane protein [Eubacteriales bacterium]